MRALFREFALRLTLVSAGVVLVVGAFAYAVLRYATIQLLQDSGGPAELLPVWVIGIGLLATVLLTLVISLPLARSMADRAAEKVADPLRRLAQRTDEMASGGFALDPEARPGRVVDPTPWRAGIPEVDAVAREVDRHHTTFSKVLVSERSFAADASHQLRTPLAALLLRLEEIAQADDAGVARTEADIAIGQVERLTGVVDELLRRTRAGHASGGALSAVDQVLAGLDEEWTPAFAESGRSIELTTERGIIVEASASALSQVLNTLLENALVHGDGQVDVRVARSGPSAVFTVSDQGPGIAAEVARSVFERGLTTGSGTGLGLSVARETAEAIGGRLELVKARPATFACYLSLAQTP